MSRSFFSLIPVLLFFTSCTSSVNEKLETTSNADSTKSNIRKLKDIAQAGDLVVRMTDDLISEQIKFLNETEKIYSHAGIIIVRDGHPYVCNISPNDAKIDTIRIETIDSFLNPAKNLACALYRYDLSKIESDSLTTILRFYETQHVTFDWLYNLATDDKMYCAELIEKALRSATGDRISIKQTNIPITMQGTVFTFFRNQHVTKKWLLKEK